MNAIKKIGISCLILFAMPVVANQDFMEGRDYTHLSKIVRSQSTIANLIKKDPHQVQVLLFFNYGCSACAKLDPKFEEWVKSEKDNSELVVYRFPVGYQDQWQMFSKLYFVMLDMEPKKDLNEKIFNSIHSGNLKLWQEEEMRNFFIANGYQAKEFDTVFNSPLVESQIKYSREIANAYFIDGTPMIVINGVNSSYLLSIDQADGIDRLCEVLNYLVAKETAKNSY